MHLLVNLSITRLYRFARVMGNKKAQRLSCALVGNSLVTLAYAAIRAGAAAVAGAAAPAVAGRVRVIHEPLLAVRTL